MLGMGFDWLASLPLWFQLDLRLFRLGNLGLRRIALFCFTPMFVGNKAENTTRCFRLCFLFVK